MITVTFSQNDLGWLLVFAIIGVFTVAGSLSLLLGALALTIRNRLRRSRPA
jgi:hypothetical protein